MLCLSLTRFKCICILMYCVTCLTAVLLSVLMYERCLPRGRGYIWHYGGCEFWRQTDTRPTFKATSLLFLDWLRQVIHQNVGIGENFWMKKGYRSTNLSAFSYLQLCRHVWLAWPMTDASHTWRHRWWPWGQRTKNCISFKSSYQDRHFGVLHVSIGPKTTTMWP